MMLPLVVAVITLSESLGMPPLPTQRAIRTRCGITRAEILAVAASDGRPLVDDDGLPSAILDTVLIDDDGLPTAAGFNIRPGSVVATASKLRAFKERKAALVSEQKAARRAAELAEERRAQAAEKLAHEQRAEAARAARREEEQRVEAARLAKRKEEERLARVARAERQEARAKAAQLGAAMQSRVVAADAETESCRSELQAAMRDQEDRHATRIESLKAELQELRADAAAKVVADSKTHAELSALRGVDDALKEV